VSHLFYLSLVTTVYSNTYKVVQISASEVSILFFRFDPMSTEAIIHLPEDGQYRPKHVGAVSYTYKMLSIYCCVDVEINNVNRFTGRNVERLF
jgi:hypothetical protein